MIVNLKTAALAFALTVGSTAAQAVDFTGQLVNGSYSSAAASGPSSPFASPQVVGPGAEFAGLFQDVFGQVWSLDVDIYSTGFTLKITESVNNGFGNVSSSPALAVDLNGLLGGGTISLLSYSCTPAGFACNTFGGGPSVSSLSYNGSLASVSLSTIRTGETYDFSLSGAAVPEPAAWLMLISGFGLLGMGLRAQRARFRGYRLTA